MEILSTGEKIKRSRIYKGITLKELCGNKISISKNNLHISKTE